jgi:Abnormal spindle-like microcephaly-assoc'd, ASPM-SPD-2-Hydin/Beta-propeller repeat
MKMGIRWARFAVLTTAGAVLVSLLCVTAIRKNTLRSHKNMTAPPVKASVDTPRWEKAYAQLPMGFEENRGQAARDVKFVSHGSGYALSLEPQEIDIALLRRRAMTASPIHRAAALRALREARKAMKTTVIRMQLEGANPTPAIAANEPLPGKSNYFIGNNHEKWVTDVPSYSRVKYSRIYPGVDVEFYGNQRRLEYDFTVAPGFDPKAIKLKIDGTQKLAINSHGDLVLHISDGDLEFQKPVIYQIVGTQRREVVGKYALASGNRVTFAVSKYDHSLPLVIDPLLFYSTYLGGTGDESGQGIAVDGNGDAFIVGSTSSADFPTVAGTAFQAKPPVFTNVNPADTLCGFVTELDPAGAHQLYSSYLCGSSGLDAAFAVALDPNGKVYVAGTTGSIDFPTTTNALIQSPLATNPNGTAFVAKMDLTASGAASLLYSSYIGGTNGDFANAVAADSSSNAYIGGQTFSSPGAAGSGGFAVTTGGLQQTPSNNVGTGFLTRIDTTKSGNASLIYSTYLGGNGANANININPLNNLTFGDAITGVAVDASNNAYVTGVTSSTGPSFPTMNAFQGTANPSNTEGGAFVTRIDTTKANTASLVYSTYLEGSTFDSGLGIALGPNNVAYVTGTTDSSDFPTTTGAFQTVANQSNTGVAFITLVDTTMSGNSSVTYSTFFGGSGTDNGSGIQADGTGNAYIVGTTGSLDFPITPGVLPSSLPNPNSSPFVVKLSPKGLGTADRIYASYFGGTGDGTDPDQGNAIAIDSHGNAYITGITVSSNMPVTTGAFQTTLNGTSDAFVAKLPLTITAAVVVFMPASLTFPAQLVTTPSATMPVTLTNNGNATLNIASIAASGDFSQSNTCGTSVAAGMTCTITVTFTPTTAGNRTGTISVSDDANGSPQTIPLSGTGTDFTITAPASETVTRGSSKMFNVTVTPLGGFNQAVMLTCTGAPTTTACAVSPTSVTPDGTNPINSQVTVMSMGLLPSVPTQGPRPSNRQIVLFAMGLALLAMVFAARRLRTRVGLAGAMLVMFAVAGCGGGHKTVTGTLTLTGTSGGVSHSATVALTVQ